MANDMDDDDKLTSLGIKFSTKRRLDEHKRVKRESYNDVIARLLDETENLR